MDPEYGAGETLRERSRQGRIKLWLYLEANRPLVVALLAAVVFAVLVAVGITYPNAVADLRDGDPVETTFQAMLGAVVTGVTIVVTLNQLVLSQEFGPAGDQRERMNGTIDFREQVADVIDAPISPPEPSAFTRALVEVAGRRAAEARDARSGDADEELDENLSALADGIGADVATTSDRLADVRFGQYEFLSAALDFDYAWKLFAARRIRAEHAAELSDEQREALDELVASLKLFGVSREHLKTLYVRSELVALSRVILLSSIPALLVSIGMLFYFDPARLTGTVLGLSVPVLAVSAAVTVALVPFLVLISYVIRLVTVAQESLSIGPFDLHESYSRSDIDWD